jgi:hypothetical protein
LDSFEKWHKYTTRKRSGEITFWGGGVDKRTPQADGTNKIENHDFEWEEGDFQQVFQEFLETAKSMEDIENVSVNSSYYGRMKNEDPMFIWYYYEDGYLHYGIANFETLPQP